MSSNGDNSGVWCFLRTWSGGWEGFKKQVRMAANKEKVKIYSSVIVSHDKGPTQAEQPGDANFGIIKSSKISHANTLSDFLSPLMDRIASKS